MPRNSNLPRVIRLFVTVFLICGLIGLAGCATPSPVIKMTQPAPDIIREYKSIVVPAGQIEMFDTGVEVKKGEQITVLAEGEIDVSPRIFRTKKPHGSLLFRLGAYNIVSRYVGQELIPVATDGNLYLGYIGSPINKYGNPKNPEYYSDDMGYYVVDIIVWKTQNPILMADFFKEASQRDPQKDILKLMATKFESRKELFLAEQKAKKELVATEKAIASLQGEELSKPKVPRGKTVESPPAVDVTKGEMLKAAQKPELQKEEPTAIPKPTGRKENPSAPPREKTVPAVRDDDKNTKDAELNEKLQKAILALQAVENIKKQMAEQMAEQQRREEEMAARLEALELEKTKQPKNIPVIAIASPADGIMVESEYISLSGVAEHEKGIEKFEILLNGVLLRSRSHRAVIPVGKKLNRIEFSERIRLEEGSNSITIHAQERDGIASEKTIAVQRSPKKGSIWAVIIGINSYHRLPSLKYAVHDAKEIYRYLTEVSGVPRDHVWLLLDEEATLERIRSVLGTQLRRKAGKEDMVIIFLAGHGSTEKDASSPDGDGLEKYILPHNADSKDLYASAIPMGEVARIFQRISSERLIFLSDTCYSGASGGRTILASGTRANVSGAFWDRVSRGKGRIVITASDANQVSAEKDELQHGVFTYYLLEGLRGKADFDGDEVITLDEVSRYVSIKVPQATGQDQPPVKKGEMTGEIILGIVKKP